MGKADRRRAQNARERVAAQQAAARRAEARRRMLIAGGSVVAVLAVVVGLVLAKALSKPPAPAAGKTAAASATSSSAVASEITSVPASVLNSVGAGPTGSSQVSALVPVSGTTLTSGGKPEMLYVGAEYCPFCAAERWAMVVALSRFGTFTNLHFIRSESSDIYSNTATLTFYRSSYTSKYLVFTPVETTTTTGAALQSPTTAQLALMNTYDAPPYVPSGDKGSFPFVDIGNKYISDGAQFLPTVLGSTQNPDPSHFGLSWAQIGKDLQDPNNPVAQAVLGSANHITAAICKVTNGQPGNVCSSAAVTAVGSRI
jgi:hypothetical protein